MASTPTQMKPVDNASTEEILDMSMTELLDEMLKMTDRKTTRLQKVRLKVVIICAQ